MTSRPVKVLACTVGLALMLAASAGAANKTKKTRKPVPQQSAATSSEHCRGANLSPCGPVYFQNYYLGDDPDPFIRSQIQRDLGVKFGDPN